MKRQITLLLLLATIMFFGFNTYSQVTGNAFLSGQTNHSGIKIKFIPNSPTARLDSTLTAADGSYSINLAGGLYQVLASKTGYQNTYLNNGAAFPIATTATLTNITLQPGNTVIVSGNVSGNWSATNIYIVNSNITIPFNSSLTIAPGTVIKFNGNYSILANGTLNAIGTSSAHITFTSNLPSPAAGNWDKIELKNSSSTISYCLIEYGNNPIFASNQNITITNNEIRYSDFFGINCIGGSSLISGNKIHEFKGGGIFAGGSSSNTTISCNEIYNGGGSSMLISGNGYGIITNSNNTVRNNIIYNINGPNAKGISVHAAGSPIIENNYIYNCRIGISIGQNVTPIPNPLIVNNTITNSSFSGIDFNGSYANGNVINNIIINNGHGISQQNVTSCSICTTTPDMVTYNLVWNNTNGNFATVMKAGIGQIVTNNANGDPIDSYFNLSKDPLFINSTPPSVTTNSPALGAGNPTYSPNIGYSASAICSQTALSVPEDKGSNILGIKTFPNPFSESLNINYSLASNTFVSIEIFDLTGKSKGRLLNEFKTKGEYELKFSGQALRSGMYILKLTTKDSKPVHQTIIKL